MSKKKLQISEETQRYLDFLRYSIDDECPVPASIDKLDWQGLYNFAVKQAIIGVIYHGIKRLPAGVPRPDTDLELTWFGMAEVIRKRNLQLNMVAAKFTRDLAKAGFRSCILKGQGNALMYPDPYMRSPGDIDVWLDATRDEIFEYVKQKDENPGEVYHHICYNIVEGIDFELHHMPMYLYNIFSNKRLQRYFKVNAAKQFKNVVALPDVAGELFRPQDEFNLIYQMVHINHHFINQGVGLRHLLDYYFLLKRQDINIYKSNIEKLLKDFSLYKFSGAVMYVLHEILGLPKESLVCPIQDRKGRFLIEELASAGNFGRYDEKYSVLGMSALKRFYTKTKRLFHIARLNPSEALFFHVIALLQTVIVQSRKMTL